MKKEFFAKKESKSIALTILTPVVLLCIALVTKPHLLAGLLICAVPLAIWKYLQAIRSAITLDDEGIWKTQQGKENSFVAWKEIVGFKRSVGGECLELLDRQGETKLVIFSRLDDADELYQIVLDKAPVQVAQQTVFKRRLFHFFYSMLFLMYFFILSWIVCEIYTRSGIDFNSFFILLSFLTLIFILLYSYLSTVYQVSIDCDHLELKTVFKRKKVPFAEIEEIQLQGMGGVIIKAKEKHIYSGFGREPFGLYTNLIKAVAQSPCRKV